MNNEDFQELFDKSKPPPESRTDPMRQESRPADQGHLVGRSLDQNLESLRIPGIDYFENFDLTKETLGQLSHRIMAERDQLKELNRPRRISNDKIHLGNRGNNVIIEMVDQHKLLNSLMDSGIFKAPSQKDSTMPNTRYRSTANEK